tara:strand:- start:466 stop:702 length:237 start_codon:yes stop_codon:yes gene_type:complete
MINWTTAEDITFVPPLRTSDHGWLMVEGEEWLITKWHHFDDFGQTIETVTARHSGALTCKEMQFYSLDEGLTWSSELD